MSFKLKILTPTTGFNRTGYTTSLVRLVMYFAQNRIYPECGEQTIDYRTIEGSGISSNRELLIQEFLESDATHVLFIDEDMGFDPRTLHIVAGRRQPIVGCNYPMRVPGAGFTALAKDRKARIITNEQSYGIEPAFYTGFGFCLIERQVFEKIQRPWFLIGFNTSTRYYTTEDAAFAHMVNEAGIPWYVDHDASKGICHIGNFNYWWNETIQKPIITSESTEWEKA